MQARIAPMADDVVIADERSEVGASLHQLIGGLESKLRRGNTQLQSAQSVQVER